MRTLDILSKKLKFVDTDPMVKDSKALKDVQPELEKLRQKAVSKVNLIHLMLRSHHSYHTEIIHTEIIQALFFFNPLSAIMHIILLVVIL